MTFSEN